MKHFYRLILALSLAIASFACATNELDEQIAANTTTTAVPEEIYADFDEESTRVQLDALCRTTWTKGDLASAFYFSDKVSVFRFMGRTGDRSGALQCISQGTGGTAIDKVVLLYPHSESYALNASKGRIGVTIPDVQYYQEGSYGVGANLMASVGEDTKFSLKNLCGWVKVQFVGAGTVSEVTLSGNGYEQVAGDATFYYNDFRLALLGQEDASEDDSELGGSLVFGEYKTTVKLDCGEGIALDPTEPTEFYLVLAPQTFEEGITVTATLTDGTTLTKSTSKPLTVERNHIVPMSPLEIVAQREIHYTATEKVEPYDKTVFGANYVSNEWDETTGKGVITFDGAVTKIGNNAFSWCSSLTSITIPDSVSEIGYYAFGGCSSLTSITIPDSVATIGGYAFQDCSSLTSITIPDSVTKIGDSAFSWCSSLTSVIIPDSVTEIGEYTFHSCSSLTSITIPDSVTEIGYCAFTGCESLTSITIPDSVTKIGDGAFTYCENLEKFEGKFASEDGRCLIVDGVLNSFARAGITEYTIPDSVTVIGDWAFSGCQSLTSIIIPDSVTEIGDGAFESCDRLTSVTIPESVTEIGERAFYHCTSLTSITIPESVTEIGSGAFGDCSSLEKIEGKFASEDGRYLIVNGVLTSFAPAGLTEYTIPDGITEIGSYVFEYCSRLTSITIPDSVTEIGSRAFDYCTSLTSVYCKAITPPTGAASMFRNNHSDRKIYVPAEIVEAYKSAQYWSDYADSIMPIYMSQIEGPEAIMRPDVCTPVNYIPDMVTAGANGVSIYVTAKETNEFTFMAVPGANVQSYRKLVAPLTTLYNSIYHSAKAANINLSTPMDTEAVNDIIRDILFDSSNTNGLCSVNNTADFASCEFDGSTATSKWGGVLPDCEYIIAIVACADEGGTEQLDLSLCYVRTPYKELIGNPSVEFNILTSYTAYQVEYTLNADCKYFYSWASTESDLMSYINAYDERMFRDFVRTSVTSPRATDDSMDFMNFGVVAPQVPLMVAAVALDENLTPAVTYQYQVFTLKQRPEVTGPAQSTITIDSDYLGANVFWINAELGNNCSSAVMKFMLKNEAEYIINNFTEEQKANYAEYLYNDGYCFGNLNFRYDSEADELLGDGYTERHGMLCEPNSEYVIVWTAKNQYGELAPIQFTDSFKTKEAVVNQPETSLEDCNMTLTLEGGDETRVVVKGIYTFQNTACIHWRYIAGVGESVVAPNENSTRDELLSYIYNDDEAVCHWYTEENSDPISWTDIFESGGVRKIAYVAEDWNGVLGEVKFASTDDIVGYDFE